MGFEHEIDDHLTVIDPGPSIKIFGLFADASVGADNIGFGEGEIMSVRILMEVHLRIGE